jgi:hypothetical protein
LGPFPTRRPGPRLGTRSDCYASQRFAVVEVLSNGSLADELESMGGPADTDDDDEEDEKEAEQEEGKKDKLGEAPPPPTSCASTHGMTDAASMTVLVSEPESTDSCACHVVAGRGNCLNADNIAAQEKALAKQRRQRAAMMSGTTKPQPPQEWRKRHAENVCGKVDMANKKARNDHGT